MLYLIYFFKSNAVFKISINDFDFSVEKSLSIKISTQNHRYTGLFTRGNFYFAATNNTNGSNY
jgi:hypothetical protein